MRVLVVDQDSTLLTAITQTLGEYFSIDAVTTKADCLDLVRVNEFEVIVAGERLEDGSGLELLGSLARSRPEMLRIFAAERERLKLLKGRLGPFGLFRTLPYPIEPRQLLAALSAAAGIEEEVEETFEAEAPPTAPAPAPAPAAPRAASARTSPRAPAASPVQASVSIAAAASSSRAQASRATAAPMPRAQASVASAATGPARSPGQKSRSGSSIGGASPSASLRQVPRQPTPSALVAASKLDIVSRPKGFPPPGDTTPARSAFLVGAGVILVLGGLALSFKIFNTKDEPVALATNASVLRAPHFPPEVVKLVTDTEVAFQQDDFKTARTDVAALQQIAPDHPRLPFFESLLKRLQATTQGSKSGSGKMFSRHTTAPTAPGATGTSSTPAAQGASNTSHASRASGAQGSDTQRRQPDTERDTASAANTVSTFSGRTLEDSNAGAAIQTLATPSQAMATPIPRRPGSAAAPPDTQEPRLIQHVAADYPQEAARKGVEGSVDVSFTISPQGKVSDVIVTSAVPSDIFNRAAIAAVRRWKYEPKTVNGVPVEAHQQLRLQFKLDPRGG
jgi:TonB family protein